MVTKKKKNKKLPWSRILPFIIIFILPILIIYLAKEIRMSGYSFSFNKNQINKNEGGDLAQKFIGENILKDEDVKNILIKETGKLCD